MKVASRSRNGSAISPREACTLRRIRSLLFDDGTHGDAAAGDGETYDVDVELPRYTMSAAVGHWSFNPAITVVLVFLWSLTALDHMAITVDGDTLALSGIGGWHAALLVVALVAVVLVALVLAALALVLVLGLAALGVAFGGLTAIVALALVASPLLLIGWLFWRLVRPAPVPHAAAA